MSRTQLELESVFPSALEAYRSADRLGEEQGCRTLVLSNEGPDGRTSWAVYSYAAPAPSRRTERGAFPAYQPGAHSPRDSSTRTTSKERVFRPAPRPSRPSQPAAQTGAVA
jgi:hypothetical protein